MFRKVASAEAIARFRLVQIKDALTYQATDLAIGRRKSPRKAGWNTSDNEGGKGKGKGKKGHQGTGDGQIRAVVPRSDALPATPVGQINTVPSQPAGNKQSTEQKGQTAAEKQLEQLVVALKQSNAELPPGVAEIVSSHAQSSTKQAAKSLHKTVTMQTAARSNLEQLRTQRRQYAAGWTSYLNSVTNILTQQFQKQEDTMAQFEEAERAWMDQLSEATSQLARLAKEGQAQGSSVEEVAGSSSEDDMDAEENHAEHIKEKEARELHRAQHRQLLETLTAAKENSEAMAAAAERSGSRDGATEFVELRSCYFVDAAMAGRAGYGLILFAWHGCAWCYVGWAGSALGTIALSSRCDDDPATLLELSILLSCYSLAMQMLQYQGTIKKWLDRWREHKLTSQENA
ncbi:hypothetical protein AK812_SmicGene8817 [Symbiodinium microadriaticum]|uniref:Uncharacterized protein n=1 Tax=Symbiodinium microadriaticum TaxID=2951 RepID=A0A1Q9EK76_SYMMI|nr:hypothetical protein AK812_SmicGene8817 [Symbiodinium microadriaticum]